MSKKQPELKPMYGTGKEYWRRLGADIIRDRWLYLLMLPGFIYFIVFKYLPMWGIVISFQNYVPYSGVMGSEWVGLKWFEYFFKFPSWTRYLTNTLILSFMNLIFYFPAPIILALLLNEMRSLRYKKVLQTLLYVPHFISIVIVVSITMVLFGPSGIVYKVTEMLLGHPINYLGSPETFRWMIVGQTIWKETGWGTIIFLAALTNVDTQLYEAAMVDGAGRLRRLWHITLPAIRSTIVLMLILRMGGIFTVGYEKIMLMYNEGTYITADVISTYVYRRAFEGGEYSFSAAVGLFNSVINFTVIMVFNRISKRISEVSLW